MSDFSEKELDSIFKKAREIKGLDSNEWRLDASGAIIRRSSYGSDDDFFGWEVDHIVPSSKLENANVPEELIDHDYNLRPLNWNNNRSKGDDYPDYTTSIVSEDEGKSNVKKEGSRTVNRQKREQLQKLYKSYIEL